VAVLVRGKVLILALSVENGHSLTTLKNPGGYCPELPGGLAQQRQGPSMQAGLVAKTGPMGRIHRRASCRASVAPRPPRQLTGLLRYGRAPSTPSQSGSKSTPSVSSPQAPISLACALPAGWSRPRRRRGGASPSRTPRWHDRAGQSCACPEFGVGQHVAHAWPRPPRNCASHEVCP
jgi:hypothetical protein